MKISNGSAEIHPDFQTLVTVMIMRIKVLAGRAGLMADTAVVTEVVMVAGFHVFQHPVVTEAANCPVWKTVLALPDNILSGIFIVREAMKLEKKI